MSNGIQYTTFRGSQSGEIVQSETSKPALSKNEVLISITASGLCGGDLMFKSNDMVIGHEGVGVVIDVGPDAILLKKGDRVGWGFLQDTCGNCQLCLDGTETFCPERKLYGFADHDQGSLAYGIVKKETRIFRIPEELTDEEAAPLMCAGATVFNALDTYGARSTQRVGVIGIGGLGHLAIQFAAKMGLDVIAFSSAEEKKTDAKAFGASASYTTAELSDLKLNPPLDLLIVTTPQQPELGPYLGLLAPKATIFPLTISQDNFSIPQMPLLMAGITVQGSVVAPRNSQQRMLAFAARHGIKPQIQKFTMDKEGIEEAFNILGSNKMRYRGVLVVPDDKRIAV